MTDSGNDRARAATIFSAITGRRGAAPEGHDLRGQLLAAYGTQRRGATVVDTRKAAKSLGVSQRTVQRWLKGTNKPSTQHAKTVQKRARQTMTTKRGRQRTIANLQKQSAGFQKITRGGATVRVTGKQGPYGYEFDRDRASYQNLTADEMQTIITAWEDKGDNGALAALEGIYDAKYVSDWTFGSVRGFEIRPEGRGDPRA